MAKLHFELVSPEKHVFSGEVDQVDVPGTEGDFGVLAGHAPFITTLRPGIMAVINGGAKESLVVFGGFAEVSPAGLTILAELAVPVADFDPTTLVKRIAELEELIAKMKTEQDSAIDREIERLDHFRTVYQHITGSALH